jgi:hypothetical protein
MSREGFDVRDAVRHRWMRSEVGIGSAAGGFALAFGILIAIVFVLPVERAIRSEPASRGLPPFERKGLPSHERGLPILLEML